MTRTPLKLSLALSALTLVAPTASLAQTKDAKLVTCGELMAMQAAEQKQMVEAMVAASADALDLDDLVSQDSTIGPVIEVCKGNPEMLAMEAAMTIGN